MVGHDHDHIMGGDVMETVWVATLVLAAFLVAFLVLLISMLLTKIMFYKPKQKEDVFFNQLTAENQAKYLYWLIIHENDD